MSARSTVMLGDSLGAMATPRELGLGLLHRLVGRGPFGLRPRRYEGPDGEGRIAGTVGALVAVGLLSEDEAEVVAHDRALDRGIEIARGLAAKPALFRTLQKQTLNAKLRRRIVQDVPFGMALEGLAPPTCLTKARDRASRPRRGIRGGGADAQAGGDQAEHQLAQRTLRRAATRARCRARFLSYLGQAEPSGRRLMRASAGQLPLYS